jgi:hypothetical protein
MPRLIRKRQINAQVQSLVAKLRGFAPRFIPPKFANGAEKPIRHNHFKAFPCSY